MYQCSFLISEDVGLHARPASNFVHTVSPFQASIFARNSSTKSDWVNAKSILCLLSLGIEQGHTMELMIQGVDEMVALSSIQKLFLKDCVSIEMSINKV